MAKKPYSKDFKLGVLGGGQLGRMLLQEAVNLDIKLAALDPNPEAPCHQIVNFFTTGDFNDRKTVREFGKDLDVVTVEIEHVSIEGLRDLEKAGVKVFPQPDMLEIVQDKGLQKEFYKEHQIPSAPYRLLNNKAELYDNTDFLPAAQKLRKGGYDGRGVFVIKSKDQIEEGFDAPTVLEKFVDFEKELSVIVARNESGEIKTFPSVELDFNPKANLVELLFAPANISDEIAKKAENIARKTIEAFGLVGILAVELFLTKEGELLVNEVAPRPHNSGHQTIEANITSQYAQHLRSILNFPLGDTDLLRPAAMVNLLGEEGHTGPVIYEGLEEALQISGVYVHLYGKTDTKPFRKMGHVTITAATADEAREKAMRVKSIIKVKAK
ncbi:5-(carboxyamino)imidazole ribonucleotide synthase [Cryomorpha ignava]|uniref:N5-carboxyaminoimidazole ribonucleotide synthase n=1 Tax=Cryomorpha ignava TaxID=101383 RepID=A0A7K3WLD2_9FLAO|nr:5-(carboxyamino)imidazole ribonucleotide synthase [Cryomorpha ignava]NEN22439.1 5-(carboxyamino)imidazole ribonucleotide synthase [Cryomorpha ignava]